MRRPILSIIVTISAWLACNAPALAAGVQDQGRFFSDSAVAKANERLAQLEQQYGKRVVVETYAQLPEPVRGRFSPESGQQIFEQWSNARIGELKLNGVLVLVVREPSRVHVNVDAGTRRQAFVTSDVDRLSRLLIERFRAKQFDEGLLEGITLVEQTLARSTPARSGGEGGAQPAAGTVPPRGETGAGQSSPRTPPPARVPDAAPRGLSMGWLCAGFALVAIVFLFIARSRARAMQAQGYGNRQGGYQQGGYQQGGDYPPGQPGYGAGGAPGGGGLGRGLLGGLLGGMLGGYAYDQFRHRGDPNSQSMGDASGDAGGAAGAGGLPPSMTDPPDTYGGAGGDFGDSSDLGGGGGGDFGGGDAGGGDFGGSGGEF